MRVYSKISLCQRHWAWQINSVILLLCFVALTALQVMAQSERWKNMTLEQQQQEMQEHGGPPLDALPTDLFLNGDENEPAPVGNTAPTKPAKSSNDGWGTEKSKFCKTSTCSSSRLCPACTLNTWCPHGIDLRGKRTCSKCQGGKTGTTGQTATTVKQPATTKPQTKPPVKPQVQRHPDDPLPLEEPTEFWSSEEKEFIQTAVGGLTLLGGGGVGLYVLLQSLGLFGAKTAATAGAVGAAATTSAGGAGAAEISLAPKIGEARSYLDDTGTRWIEVFDGNNWVDSATHSASQAQVADNQAWQQREFERQSSGDTAFNQELKQKADERAKEWAIKREETRNEIRNINRTLQELAESAQKRAEITLEAKEFQLNVLEGAKTVIDCGVIPVLSTFGGPAGTLISSAYTVASEVAGGATEGFVNSSSTSEALKNAAKGAVTGFGKGAVNVIVCEGLNAASAVGSTAVRTVFSKTPTKVMHCDSSSAELVKKLWNNASSGKKLTTGLVKAPLQVPPQIKLRMNLTNSIQIEKRAWQISNMKDVIKAERNSNIIWGAASSGKSFFVDRHVAGAVNQSLFAN
ncbi:MAG: hypothetical protein KKB51_01605 [Candidatus Riflebacteria bacterium]|nr:hypothetical protein [Candidatus Riflebacteria bacterium]